MPPVHVPGRARDAGGEQGAVVQVRRERDLRQGRGQVQLSPHDRGQTQQTLQVSRSISIFTEFINLKVTFNHGSAILSQKVEQ